MARFREAYHRWWREVAEPEGGAFARAVRSRLADPWLGEEVSRFACFYGATLPEGTVGRFSLIFRADAPGPTNGQQLQGVADDEFHADERPESRIGTLIHEFCRFLYGARPPEADSALQTAFMASDDPIAKPALNLMNEALATTPGNGIVGRCYAEGARWARLLATPRSLYNDDEIDRLAKRLLPAIAAFVDAGGAWTTPASRRPIWPRCGMSSATGSCGLRGMLKEAFVLTEACFGPGFSRRTVRAMKIAGAYREEATVDDGSLGDFAAQPNLSALFVVSSARLDEMVAHRVIDAGEAEALRAASAGETSAVLGRPRTRFASTYVVVAEGADAALDGVGRPQGRTTPLIGILP